VVTDLLPTNQGAYLARWKGDDERQDTSLEYLWHAGVVSCSGSLGTPDQRPLLQRNYSIALVLAGAESRWVTVAGLRIHYDVLGPAAGPPVVLVHGLGGRAEGWMDLAHYLIKAGYRVYLPDLLGYGRSQAPTYFSYSVPNEAVIVFGFLDAVGLKQVDLGSISMGGWIVQFVTSKHPERVRRLMLFDSAGIHEQPSWNTRLFTPSTPAEVSQINALLYPHPHGKRADGESAAQPPAAKQHVAPRRIIYTWMPPTA